MPRPNLPEPGAALAVIKAKPFGRPTAGLDDTSTRRRESGAGRDEGKAASRTREIQGKKEQRMM